MGIGGNADVDNCSHSSVVIFNAVCVRIVSN